jgi:hypothetical protein
MGNRGVLHDEEEHIRRTWQVKRWLVCVLEFKGRHRKVMTPGHYTELFFLDEVTALAAGHRPCAECRHDRFLAFCDGWKSAHSADGTGQRATAAEIDSRLHAERLTAERCQRTYLADLNALPDGVLVQHVSRGEDAYLVWDGGLHAWTPGGYIRRLARPERAEVVVLTPASTVRTLRAGFIPAVHPSAMNPGGPT